LQDRITLSKMVSPLQHEDEFAHFRKIILGIRNTSVELFQSIIQHLEDDSQQQYLRELLQIKRVVIDAKSQQTVPRKIVQVKHKANLGAQ